MGSRAFCPQGKGAAGPGGRAIDPMSASRAWRRNHRRLSPRGSRHPKKRTTHPRLPQVTRGDGADRVFCLGGGRGRAPGGWHHQPHACQLRVKKEFWAALSPRDSRFQSPPRHRDHQPEDIVSRTSRWGPPLFAPGRRTWPGPGKHAQSTRCMLGHEEMGSPASGPLNATAFESRKKTTTHPRWRRVARGDGAVRVLRPGGGRGRAPGSWDHRPDVCRVMADVCRGLYEANYDWDIFISQWTTPGNNAVNAGLPLSCTEPCVPQLCGIMFPDPTGLEE
jgi:hypothetical protein